ncbi:hypothetical protein BJX61DRAFT_351457 [Aspergillus egyptiacus]|nr:hypothetical protein BJX61DRAFT_351457 [Aspergillus egyptiacus]
MSKKLDIVLQTTLTLADQFQATLTSAQAGSEGEAAGGKDDGLDPLKLLSVSATALKSHVTKLSLLTITSPFTPSAVATPLSALNESVLPSLVTAALLVTPESHTKAFQSEIRVLTGTTLKEFSMLVKEVQAVAEGKARTEVLQQSGKDTVTVATGRVWDACDVLVDVATKGVVGFVVRRAEEYRDLVKDAVEEIEGWDPDEDDDFFDDLLEDDGDEAGGESNDDNDEDGQSATLNARKKDALRILKPIAQIYPAIILNRLKKAPSPPPAPSVRTLEALMKNLQQIPDYIDEVAGALYEADLEKFMRQLGKTGICARKAVELVALPWDAKQSPGSKEGAGDKFTTWSKTWAKVLEEVGKSIEGSSNPGSG